MSQSPFHIRVACLLLVALTVAGPKMTLGQDAFGNDYARVLDKMQAARSQIRSYDLTVTAKVDLREKTQKLSTGKTIEVTKPPIGYTLHLTFDSIQKRMLALRQDTLLDKATGAKETSPWRALGIRLSADSSEERLRFTNDKFFGHGVRFFDPLGLGLAFQADLKVGSPWRRLISDQRNWGSDFRCTELARGERIYESADYVIQVDPSRDYWPIMAIQRTQATPKFELKTEIQLARYDGHWLPKTATLHSTIETQKLKFQWHAVNQPIAKDRFEPPAIRKRYGLSKYFGEPSGAR